MYFFCVFSFRIYGRNECNMKYEEAEGKMTEEEGVERELEARRLPED